MDIVFDQSNASQALIEVCSTNDRYNIAPVYKKNEHEFELSKSKAYNLFTLAGICVPYSRIFSTVTEAINQLPKTYPYVVKVDGGNFGPDIRTVVVKSKDDLKGLIKLKLTLDENSICVLQDFIQGYEYTVAILMNNLNWQRIGSANDYKKLHNNDQGVNSNGMGSIYPARKEHPATDSVINKIVSVIQENYPGYKGILSCQFIVDDKKLWLLETNARPCDPEFQSICSSLDDSMADRLVECYTSEYIQPIKYKNINAVTVTLVHKNWPNLSWDEKSLPTPESSKFKIFNSAQVVGDMAGHVTVTNSGTKSHLELAKEIYQWLHTIDTSHYHYRTDIGIQ